MSRSSSESLRGGAENSRRWPVQRLRRLPLAQSCERLAEADAVCAPDEVDHIAAGAAAEAVEAPRLWVDDEARAAVFVERAAAAQAPAAGTQLDAVCRDHLRDGMGTLHALGVVRHHDYPGAAVAASSAGSVVAASCSSGLASTLSAM